LIGIEKRLPKNRHLSRVAGQGNVARSDKRECVCLAGFDKGSQVKPCATSGLDAFSISGTSQQCQLAAHDRMSVRAAHARGSKEQKSPFSNAPSSALGIIFLGSIYPAMPMNSPFAETPGMTPMASAWRRFSARLKVNA